jgi:hypothetical protein
LFTLCRDQLLDASGNVGAMSGLPGRSSIGPVTSGAIRFRRTAGLLQAEQEMRVAGQSVQLCDDEPCAASPARREGFRELWTIAIRAALDLGELRDDLPFAAVKLVMNRLALRLEAEARCALLGRA